MELVEPSVTQSSKNDTDVYRHYSRNGCIYARSYETQRLEHLGKILLPLLRGSSMSTCWFIQPVSEPIKFKIQEYLNRFSSDVSEVKKNIDTWISHLNSEFDSEESIAITDDDELLIYWHKGSDLFNILIDEDFEIELIYIPSDRRKSQNKFLQGVMDTTTETIKKAFDGMQQNN